MDNHHHCLECGDICPPNQQYCFRHKKYENKLVSPRLEQAISEWMETREKLDPVDVDGVMAQTGSTKTEVVKALIKNRNDLAKTILDLTEEKQP
jgi:NACalpha-BTF3-like transcription factor